MCIQAGRSWCLCTYLSILNSMNMHEALREQREKKSFLGGGGGGVVVGGCKAGIMTDSRHHDDSRHPGTSDFD